MTALPHGWFNQSDIDYYRDIYSNLPNGASTAEVGCWMGRSICSVADIIRKKNISVVVVDTFGGTQGEPSLLKTAKEQDILSVFRDNITLFKIYDNIHIIKMLSYEAPTFIRTKFDFIFIDADHSYESCKKDVESWTPLLLPTGIISGHDYHSGVKKAVDEKFGKSVIHKGNIWEVRVH